MKYLRDTWYVAMWAEQLRPGEFSTRTVLNQPIVLYRQQNGAPAALFDRCPHRFAPLSRGKLLPDGALQCGYHGLQFDAAGACVRNPHGDGKLPPAKARAYPVVERHSIVWIWMGDPAKADPAIIPDFPMLDENSGHQLSARDWIRMEANYELITDNLLDLSHVSFLHENILGNAETIPAAIKVEQSGNRITVRRFMPNVHAIGLFDLLYHRDGRPVDMWTDMRWDAPGCMLNDAGVTEPGGTRAQGTGIFGTHFLTPETDRTTIYHFCAARQNPLPVSPDVAADLRTKLTELRRIAFGEQDEPMIRAQQAAFDRAAPGELRPTLLTIDAGPVRYKQILERLIARENTAQDQVA